jgi:TRAP transporter TAXI family solute receptor
LLIFSDGLKKIEYAAPANGVNREKYLITILTGPSSGIYYPVGGAFSTFLASIGYKTSATATGGSAENINALLSGQGEMAIAMADAVIQAIDAFGAYADELPAKDLRAMMSLWPNVCQIVTTADSGIRNFEDIRGKRIGVGAPNSGVELNARMIFEVHGISYSDVKVDYLSYGEAIEQMKKEKCDAAFVTSGLGNTVIMEFGTTKKLSFIPVEGAALKSLIKKYPFYIKSKIPAAIYKTDKDVTTAAVMNIMLVNVKLPDDVVYDLLANIYSDKGLEAIHASHVAAKANINIDTALRGIKDTSIPIHNGAIKFYKENDLIK